MNTMGGNRTVCLTERDFSRMMRTEGDEEGSLCLISELFIPRYRRAEYGLEVDDRVWNPGWERDRVWDKVLVSTASRDQTECLVFRGIRKDGD